MRLRFATAALLIAASGSAQAQMRPGAYGGGLVEYLIAGGAGQSGRGAAYPAAVPDRGRTAQPRPGATGRAGWAPRAVEPARTQLAALPAPRRGNPYEDGEPIDYPADPLPEARSSFMPESRSVAAAPSASPAYAPSRQPAYYPVDPRFAPQPVQQAMTQPMTQPWRQPLPQTTRGPAAAAIARTPDPRFARQVVAYDGRQRPGTIVIDTASRLLYLVQPGGTAIRYGIGVGRPGFLWHGVKQVSAKKQWPDWTPPPEMMRRRPDLPNFMAGGPENPLGARALYLGSSLYRIHGTNEPHTIGQAVSSGCIRMMNDDVVDLYERTPVGARVEVI